MCYVPKDECDLSFKGHTFSYLIGLWAVTTCQKKLWTDFNRYLFLT